MRDTFVPMTFVKRLLEQARKSGCDIPALLANCQVSEAELNKKKDISARKYGALYRAAMLSTQNEWFGMFAGGRVPLGAFRMMALTLLQCHNLRQAIIRAGEFAEICRGMRTRFLLQQEGDLAILRMGPIHSVSEAEFNQLLLNTSYDAVLTTMYTWNRFSEWLIDQKIVVTHFALQCDAAQIETPLALGDRKALLFKQQANSLQFPAKYLDAPVVQNEDSLHAFMMSAPYHLVTEDPAHIDTAEKVRSLLKREVGNSMPSADEIAFKLNVSVTTLRRQLQKQETSFQKLKDECRMEAAVHFLSCSDLSNADIADKLGFDEPSAFFRSFKKWTGLTPGEYRQHL